VHVSSNRGSRLASTCMPTGDTPLTSIVGWTYVWARPVEKRAQSWGWNSVSTSKSCGLRRSLTSGSSIPRAPWKRVGNLFVAWVAEMSVRSGDLEFAARTLAWIAGCFDEAPAALNLLSPALQRGELVRHLRIRNPDLRGVATRALFLRRGRPSSFRSAAARKPS